ncbi:small ribosomal subunit protein mS31 [Mantella aurantiaca]
MYGRVLLTLYRAGRGRTAGSVTVSRFTDPIVKCFSLGSVHCSEKKPPENEVISNPPGEGMKPPENEVTASSHEEEKTDKKDASQPPVEEGLMNIIRGMKVDVSSQKMLLALKKGKQEEQKYLDRRVEFESASKMFQKALKDNQPEKETVVSPEMAAAVSAVASTFPNKKNQVESELLRHLRLHKQMIEKQGKEDMNIKNVISGMQVQQKSKQFKKEDELMPNILIKSKKSSPKLVTGKRLNIFPVPPVSKEQTITESSPTLWDIELAKEIATASESPARNGFEEMIQWTNEGKLWTFPINNEAGLDDEQNVEFHEHIFLDKYLEDFPNEGPIRHFMELVVCGLSKNPYLTVQQKKEHIDWFRDYFIQKEDVLRECDVHLN